MLIFADKKIPGKALEKLSGYGEVINLETNGIVYEAISGHPDIFLARIENTWVLAPNLPEIFIQKLRDYQVSFVLGEEGVGMKYPASSKYNVVADQHFIIHNFRNTDSKIIQLADDTDLIQVDQGYTRCNLIPLGNRCYITCDKGIERTLKRFDLEVLYVDPEGILLPGYKNGFIGGCTGILDKTIFFTGNPDYLKEGKQLRTFLESKNFEIVELYDGPLFDGGSLFFI